MATKKTYAHVKLLSTSWKDPHGCLIEALISVDTDLPSLSTQGQFYGSVVMVIDGINIDRRRRDGYQYTFSPHRWYITVLTPL